MSSLNVETFHFSVIVQFNAYIFLLKTMGGGGFWPYTWCQSQNMRQKHLKQTVNATWYSWLKHLCQCTLIHTHAREQTFLIFLSYTELEKYTEWKETLSASAKINIRASDPEIKLRNKCWVKHSWGEKVTCPNCSQYALHGWISQERVTVIFHSTFVKFINIFVQHL